MIYYIIFLLLYPLLFILSFFRKKTNQNLIIQTAKIGDYVNTSVMFEPLEKLDVVIDKINTPFSQHDSRINQIFIINDYKSSLFSKLQLAFIIFTNNYENVYIMMPNSYNLFLGQMSFSHNKVSLSTYSDKWYNKLFSFGIKKIKHTKEDLTIKSYLTMISSDLEPDICWKKIQEPLYIPKQSILNQNSHFKIGISLTAGNKLKTINLDTWLKIFKLLDNFDCEVYIFGLAKEVDILKNLQFNLNLHKVQIISLLGKINLDELPYYTSKMNLYISSDTGNSYIADSFKIPLINFAGPCYMKEQRPIGNNVLIINSNADCVPFSFIFKAPYNTNCKNLYKITTEQEKIILNFTTSVYNNYIQH